MEGFQAINGSFETRVMPSSPAGTHKLKTSWRKDSFSTLRVRVVNRGVGVCERLLTAVGVHSKGESGLSNISMQKVEKHKRLDDSSQIAWTKHAINKSIAGLPLDPL